MIEGKGAHAAYPHGSLDPVLAGAQMVTALQSIVSRNIDPLAACVVSVTQFQAGTTHNVIPQTATLGGTVRALEASIRDLAESRLKAIVAGTAKAGGVEVSVAYRRGYPVTRNHPPPGDLRRRRGRSPRRPSGRRHRHGADHGRGGFRLYARGPVPAR